MNIRDILQKGLYQRALYKNTHPFCLIVLICRRKIVLVWKKKIPLFLLKMNILKTR